MIRRINNHNKKFESQFSFENDHQDLLQELKNDDRFVVTELYKNTHWLINDTINEIWFIIFKFTANDDEYNVYTGCIDRVGCSTIEYSDIFYKNNSNQYSTGLRRVLSDIDL